MKIQEIQMTLSDFTNNQVRYVEFDNFEEYCKLVDTDIKSLIVLCKTEDMLIIRFFSSRLNKDILHIGAC
jgi:hypothetical protein